MALEKSLDRLWTTKNFKSIVEQSHGPVSTYKVMTQFQVSERWQTTLCREPQS